MGTHIKEKTLLDLLGERHDEWIKMVISMNNGDSINIDDVNDIVQEMYIRLEKYIQTPDKIMYGNNINTYYVYVTLQNLYLSYFKKKMKNEKLYLSLTNYNDNEEKSFLIKEYLIQDMYQTEYDYEKDMYQTEYDKRIMDEINSWHHYHSKLFKIIYIDGVSMRQLSRETGISLSNIHNTIKKCREIIKNKFGEDYNDYYKD